MHDFIYKDDICTINEYDGCGRPPLPKNKIKEKFPIWLPSHPPSYDMEADCFPVSESTENKLEPYLWGRELN